MYDDAELDLLDVSRIERSESGSSMFVDNVELDDWLIYNLRWQFWAGSSYFIIRTHR